MIALSEVLLRLTQWGVRERTSTTVEEDLKDDILKLELELDTEQNEIDFEGDFDEGICLNLSVQNTGAGHESPLGEHYLLLRPDRENSHTYNIH